MTGPRIMTSKPETVSQEAIPKEIWVAAWHCAETALRGLPDDYGDVTEEITCIAHAIMAAERRGEEREREACIETAVDVGNFGNYRRGELTSDFGQPRYDMMVSIVSAIGNRGEVNTVHNQKVLED